jgi:hypothetical protein
MLNLSNARLANGAILLAIFEGRRGSFVLAHNEGASMPFVTWEIDPFSPPEAMIVFSGDYFENRDEAQADLLRRSGGSL